MWAKIAGCAVLALSGWAAGRYAAKTENDIPDAFSALYALARFMLRGVENGIPLGGIFRAYSDSFLEERGALRALRRGGNDMPAAWREAVEKLPFGAADKKQIAAFGADLGRLPRESQRKRLEELCDALREKEACARKGLAAKQKSLRAAGLLLGLLAAIILF